MTCLKENGLQLKFLLSTPHFMVDITQRTCVSNQRINKYALWWPYLNHRRSGFQSIFCWSLIVDLLMEHKFCCVHLISRSCRTWKTNCINTHIPSIHKTPYRSIDITTIGSQVPTWTWYSQMHISMSQEYSTKHSIWGSEWNSISHHLCMHPNSTRVPQWGWTMLNHF